MNICAKTYLQKGTSRNPRSKVKLEMRRDVVYQMNSSIYEKKVRRRNCSMNSWRDEKRITFNNNHSFMPICARIWLLGVMLLSWNERLLVDERRECWKRNRQFTISGYKTVTLTHTHTPRTEIRKRYLYLTFVCCPECVFMRQLFVNQNLINIKVNNKQSWLSSISHHFTQSNKRGFTWSENSKYNQKGPLSTW